ncbi:hypothetical protein [Streptococcus sp. Marseille-Q0941]|nr:hypothetical protein [Streptococcus sp. Marseille-Q0941]
MTDKDGNLLRFGNYTGWRSSEIGNQHNANHAPTIQVAKPVCRP